MRRFHALSRRQRGIAMILVVVALTTATVLTTGYVASRDAAPEIGRKAEEASDSMWGARSAANLAVAMLQTEMRWSDADPDKLIESLQLAGADVKVVVTDLDGNPPDEDDLDLIVTATAQAGGFETKAQKIVSYRPPVPIKEAFDPYLKEFALYAIDEIETDSKSAVGVWGASPTPASYPKVGFAFEASADCKVSSPITLIASEIYVHAGATGSLQAMTSDPAYRGGAVMPVAPPAVKAELPGAFNGLPTPYAPLKLPIPQDVTATTQTGDLLYGRYDDVKVEKGSVVTLDDAPHGLYAMDHFDVESGSTIVIKGHVHLGVNQLEMRGGSNIEFYDDDSTLTIYVNEKIDIDDSAIGAPRAWARTSSSTRSVNDIPYLDPTRITVLGIGSGSPSIKLANKSAAVAAIHAPNTELRVESASALFGRATANRIHLANATVAYDPALDSRSGFTNVNGPLYDNEGGLLAEVGELIEGLSIASTLDSLLGGIADLTDSLTPDSEVTLSESDPASPRDPDRAVGRDWPTQALSIELAASTSSLGAGDYFAVRDKEPTSENLDVGGEPVILSEAGEPEMIGDE